MKIGNLNTIPIDGIYTHPDLTITEQTIVEIVAGEIGLLHKINLDVSELLVNATIRVYYKVDGANYRLRYGMGVSGGTIMWTTADGPWLAIPIDDIIDHDIKLTIESAAAGEAAARNIPFSYNGAK